MKKHLILFFSLLITVNSFSQKRFKRDAENRFSGFITSNLIHPQEDQQGFMKNFTLGIQWWDFLGEPMEFYSFKWEASGTIMLGTGKFLYRDKLKKYPDLLKRFDNIKPTNLSISISGNENNSTVSSFRYELSDWQILYSKAGVESKNLSPGSPKTWNDFWQWSWGLTNSEKYNLPNSEFENLSSTEKKELLSKLKAKYKNCHTIYLKAHIDKLEWPKYEIESIYNAFLKYEKGEETPSPLEEVKAAKNSIAKATTYTKDDFWGELVDIEDPEVEFFEVRKEDGYYRGLKEKKSGKIIIQFKNQVFYPLIEPGEDNQGITSSPSDGYYILRDNSISPPKYQLLNNKGESLFENTQYCFVKGKIRFTNHWIQSHVYNYNWDWQSYISNINTDERAVICIIYGTEKRGIYTSLKANYYYLDNLELIKKDIELL